MSVTEKRKNLQKSGSSHKLGALAPGPSVESRLLLCVCILIVLPNLTTVCMLVHGLRLRSHSLNEDVMLRYNSQFSSI